MLRHYIDYLIEKRFPLEWYIEGGRSRSGKLLPPRFGLLAYVVDAYRRGKSEDVFLIPVSIAYDQIQDVGDYAAEQRGGAEAARELRLVPRASCARLRPPLRRHPHPLRRAALAREGARPARSRRRARPRRAEPRAPEARLRGVRAHQPRDADHADLAGDAGAARPRRPRAHACAEVVRALRNLLAYVAPARAADHRASSSSTRRRASQRALDALVESGVVDLLRRGPRGRSTRSRPSEHLDGGLLPQHRHPLLRERRDRRARAAARRRATTSTTARREFWDEAMRLRDLLKFEFFFAEKDAFRGELAPSSRCTTRTGRSALARGRGRDRSELRARASGRSTRTACCGRSSRRTASSPTASSGATRPRPGTSRVPVRVPRARQAVPAAAPHPQRRVGLAGALRDRAPAREQPEARRSGPGRGGGAQALRGRDPRVAPPRRRHRGARRARRAGLLD